MKPELIYRPMQPGEAFTVCAMVERCFNTFVAPDYRAEGRQAFMSFAAAEPMAQRQQTGNIVLVADCGGLIMATLTKMDEKRQPIKTKSISGQKLQVRCICPDYL